MAAPACGGRKRTQKTPFFSYILLPTTTAQHRRSAEAAIPQIPRQTAMDTYRATPAASRASAGSLRRRTVHRQGGGHQRGDTLSVLRKGKAVKVRLHGMDTPERKQAFGTRARQFTSDLAFHQVVTVVVHNTDRYGRLVGEVLLPDGGSLNQELVRAGLAWWSRQYAPHDTMLQQLEEEARKEQRGLWSDPHAVAPWEYRKQGR
jgi:micrococcal nuclease